MSAVMSAETAFTIGRFTIVRTLGRGAQGSVYLAHDPHLERQVAIKAVGAGASAEQIKRLLQEARVVSRFSHPNIVTLYDAIEHDGGQTVKLQSSGQGFRVSADGKSMTNAADGQIAQVRTSNGQTVSGVARAGGVVEMRN